MIFFQILKQHQNNSMQFLTRKTILAQKTPIFYTLIIIFQLDSHSIIHTTAHAYPSISSQLLYQTYFRKHMWSTHTYKTSQFFPKRQTKIIPLNLVSLETLPKKAAACKDFKLFSTAYVDIPSSLLASNREDQHQPQRFNGLNIRSFS